MKKNSLSLDAWMTKNRWTNVAMAKEITERGHGVHQSTIHQIRHKKLLTSGRLALAIHEFTGGEVSLDEILMDIKEA